LASSRPLYIQSLPDRVVVVAISDIETLSTGLRRKIWGKIVLLDAWNDDQKDVSAVLRSGVARRDV